MFSVSSFKCDKPPLSLSLFIGLDLVAIGEDSFLPASKLPVEICGIRILSAKSPLDLLWAEN